MRAAKDRKRLARADLARQWQCVRVLTIIDPRVPSDIGHVWRLLASPDGRHVALEIDGAQRVCGSERKVRAALAGAMWRAATFH